MKHKENHCVKIPNQDNRPIQSIMSMSQVKTREPSMCNQEVSTTDKLIKHHICFTLSSSLTLQNVPSGVAILWTPHFGSTSMRFPLDGELDFYLKKLILLIIWKWLGVATYFCFIFKRVNKIRKKTLSVTPYLEKVIYEKPDRVRGSGYLSGRYGKDRSTPLSP